MYDSWFQFIYTYSCYDGDDHGANNAIVIDHDLSHEFEAILVCM